MLRRPLYILVATSLMFTLGSVGASVINLTGSDPVLGEGTTTGRCAKDIYISVPVTNDNNNGGGNDLKVVHVNVTGDFYSQPPLWINNELVNQGNQLNPPNKLDISEISVVAALTWE